MATTLATAIPQDLVTRLQFLDEIRGSRAEPTRDDFR